MGATDVVGQRDPAGQFVQFDADARLYVPAVHATAVPPVQLEPAGQGLHVDPVVY